MSFVSIVSREDWCSVVSDGRCMMSDKVTDENYKKFIQPSPNLFVAFAGHKEPCEIVCRGMVELGHIEKPMEVAAMHMFGMVHELGARGFKLFIAIGGSENSTIQVYSMSSIYSEPIIHKPKGNDVCYSFLSNTVVSDESLEEKFQKLARRNGTSSHAEIHSTQVALNRWVSLQDDSVNTNTFSCHISNV